MQSGAQPIELIQWRLKILQVHIVKNAYACSCYVTSHPATLCYTLLCYVKLHYVTLSSVVLNEQLILRTDQRGLEDNYFFLENYIARSYCKEYLCLMLLRHVTTRHVM